MTSESSMLDVLVVLGVGLGAGEAAPNESKYNNVSEDGLIGGKSTL